MPIISSGTTLPNGRAASVFSGGAVLEDVYPGIDLVVSGAEGLKYDWRVAAGADASMIVLEFEGQDAIRVEDGLLYVRTSAGNVIEQRPVAWQEKNGALKCPVRCDYAIEGNRVRYDFPDGTDPPFPLVIDPIVVLQFSYTGQLRGQLRVHGHLRRRSVTLRWWQRVRSGLSDHAGRAADHLQWRHHRHGHLQVQPGRAQAWSGAPTSEVRQNDLPHSMVVNSDDELFILGTSGSTDFPLTSAGCFDNTFGGGTSPPFGGLLRIHLFTGGTDIVVVHLNATATESHRFHLRGRVGATTG